MIGITKGGLAPLALLAERLHINRIITISANSYDGQQRGRLNITYLPEIDLSGQNILLIDEIVGTGETLRHISEILINDYKVRKLKTVTMVAGKDKHSFHPDFFAAEVDNWIVFPWEKSDSPK